jgi:Uma2 family endonuclease
VACNPTVDDCELVIVDEETGEEKRRIKKALHNPILIAEVWSKGNVKAEKETKLGHYEQIDTLQHYLTIEQNTREFLHYQKNGSGSWEQPVRYHEENPLVEMVIGIAIRLNLTDLYYKVP